MGEMFRNEALKLVGKWNLIFELTAFSFEHSAVGFVKNMAVVIKNILTLFALCLLPCPY
jgi:hypothetical protein